MEDLVSIITASYNSSQFIAETIEAIIGQSYKNWELLITDDCSTDNSVEVISKYVERDSRIRLLRMEKNSGAGNCRNRSIEAAKGRYIAFCDSDDVWMPHKLEKQLTFMRQKDCALTYSSYMMMDEAGNVWSANICQNQETVKSMIRDNGIGCLTAIYDTAKIGKVYMHPIRKRQDWALWLTIIKQTGVAYGMKEPLAYYRVRKGSLSSDPFSLVKFHVDVYRLVLGYSYLRALLTVLFIYMPYNKMKHQRMKFNAL